MASCKTIGILSLREGTDTHVKPPVQNKVDPLWRSPKSCRITVKKQVTFWSIGESILFVPVSKPFPKRIPRSRYPTDAFEWHQYILPPNNNCLLCTVCWQSRCRKVPCFCGTLHFLAELSIFADFCSFVKIRPPKPRPFRLAMDRKMTRPLNRSNCLSPLTMVSPVFSK